MWRYPASSAVLTDCSVSAGGTLNTPNPSAGIDLPSFSATEGLEEPDMTRSLPGVSHAPVTAGGWAARLQNAATAAGLKAIPRVPTRAKRLLSGGRAITIDGNTLDPTLQLALAGMRAFGMNGLVIGRDVAVSRAQLREMTHGFG